MIGYDNEAKLEHTSREIGLTTLVSLLVMDLMTCIGIWWHISSMVLPSNAFETLDLRRANGMGEHRHLLWEGR